MRLIMKYILFILSFVAYLSAAGGGGGGNYYDCFGYGDALNKAPGTDYYAEGKIIEEGFCSGNGCYVNCVWNQNVGEVIQQNGDGKNPPRVKFRDDVASSLTWFHHCKVDSCTKQGNDTELIRCYECKHTSLVKRPSSPAPEPEPEPEPEPIDLIVEEQNFLGTKPPNVVFTKTTGSSINLRIYDKSSSGSFGSGLNGASCVVYRDGKQVASGEGKYSFWSGGGAYLFDNTNALTQAGQYSVQCTGKDKNNKEVKSGMLPFYVAPASYTAGLNIVANGKTYTINQVKGTSNGETKKASLNSESFPIEKVGSSFSLLLNGSANANNGSVDSGVNTSMDQVGQIQNTIDGLNATSGTKMCQVDISDLPTNFKTAITNGKFNDTQASSLTFKEVYQGNLTISYTDQQMKSKIDSEKARGGCFSNGTGNGECPVPPTFEFTFKFLVVPDNFKIIAKNNNGDDIKVLYYGQGSTPENEGKTNLKVIPLNTDGSALKNFVNGCAALDTDLELNGKEVSITFIDPNNPNINSKATTIRKEEFLTQSDTTAMADLNRVLSVKRQDGSEWTPAMVAEPSFFNGDITPLMYFTGKKDDPAYPQYTPTLESFSNTVILRGRINMIDADNADDYSKMPVSKVYYEFYCQTCNLQNVGKITGVEKYSGSATSQGWWVDTTFDKFNTSRIQKENITTNPTNLSVSSVDDFKNGLQNVNYNGGAKAGKYEVKINQSKDNNSFPLFLLYNPYYNANAANGTSSFVTIYTKLGNENRDFGVDTGDSKNARSGSRTGGF